MNVKCSECDRVVIQNGTDISHWLCSENKGIEVFTCIFCALSVEPGSLEAISELGLDGGNYPIKQLVYGIDIL